MHSVLIALAIGGTVMMSMLAAAMVSIREAELRATASHSSGNAHSPPLV